MAAQRGVFVLREGGATLPPAVYFFSTQLSLPFFCTDKREETTAQDLHVAEPVLGQRVDGERKGDDVAS